MIEFRKIILIQSSYTINHRNVSYNAKHFLTAKLQVPAATGKLKNVSKFDASHFGIHRKQTESMDPMTWHTLERSFEAVMDAGMSQSF